MAKYIINDIRISLYAHVTYEFQSESTPYSLPECQGTLCLKLNRRVFDYKLSDCGLESRCCHIRISSDESDKEDSDEKSPDQENSNKKISNY